MQLDEQRLRFRDAMASLSAAALPPRRYAR